MDPTDKNPAAHGLHRPPPYLDPKHEAFFHAVVAELHAVHGTVTASDLSLCGTAAQAAQGEANAREAEAGFRALGDLQNQLKAQSAAMAEPARNGQP